MSNDLRVQELLTLLMTSDCTPEQACVNDADLLSLVKSQWQKIRRIENHLDQIFPNSDSPFETEGSAIDPTTGFPVIEGYDVRSIVGRGGMGIVFKAVHGRLNRSVALKMLLSGIYASRGELERFQREAKAIAGLRHPNIVQVYDVGEVAGRPYFTLELIEGGNLAQKIQGQPQPVRTTAELVATLTAAVHFAHTSGIIHRDLKPSNILLMPDGTPKIADFGLARSIETDRDFTYSGARVGTPGYMSPEQVLGNQANVGPAADIYALGVILYEMLAGSPPLVGSSTTETERLVLVQEPSAIRRVNPDVPRDLETICLKCLQKNASRRYGSAQDLADDLHRFLDHKPVLARPVGQVERAAKWVRRSPWRASLIMVSTVATIAALGTGIWLHHQAELRKQELYRREELALQAIQSAITNAYRSAGDNRWRETYSILDEANSHLPNTKSVDSAAEIEAARAEMRFVEELDTIRQQAAAAEFERIMMGESLDERQAAQTKARFLRAGYDVDLYVSSAAERIRTSRLKAQLVTALEQWALAEMKSKHSSDVERLLSIARLAGQQSPWHDHFHSAAGWNNPKILRELADDVASSSAAPTANQLAVLSSLLQLHGEKSLGLKFLREALRLQPGELWLNWEMAIVLSREKKHAEAAVYFRIINAMRPGNPWTINRLAAALGSSGNAEEAITLLQQAVKLEPDSPGLRHNLAVALIIAGRIAEAEDECRRSIEAHPNDSALPLALAKLLVNENRHLEAIPFFEKAVSFGRKSSEAHSRFAETLATVGRFEEALQEFQAVDKRAPEYASSRYGVAKMLLKLRRFSAAVVEYESLIRELVSKLGSSPDNLVSSDANYLSFHLELVEALVGAGRFQDAIVQGNRTLELTGIDNFRQGTLRSRIAISQALVPYEKELSDGPRESIKSLDSSTKLALAEWYFPIRFQPAAATQQYSDLDLERSNTSGDIRANRAFDAACAASVASEGLGDAAVLDLQTRAQFRGIALKWLLADLHNKDERFKVGKVAEQEAISRSFLEWMQSPYLAAIRDADRLASLPEYERKQLQSLWSDVKSFAERTPLATISKARASLAEKKWLQAAQIYSTIVRETPATDGEVWFEYGAVQLLSADLEGFRRTAQKMVEAADGGKVRGFLAARTATLKSDSIADWSPCLRASKAELHWAADLFWAQTVTGALKYRQKLYRESITHFERSLQSESKPGIAIINWLWLAMAHHQLGEKDEANHWLKRAQQWLDQYPIKMPDTSNSVGLHIHNWLEAHVLRAEAELLMQSSGPHSDESSPNPAETNH